ncbi:MAG: hypothetical protein O7I93_01030 [Gemmatimonadetes bacterium]|nr:hypothetical protein [Gemmatimonadota bacterium]
MKTTATHPRRRVRPRFRGAPMLAIWIVFAVSGCDSLLDVTNPNNVVGEDLLDPTAATAVANGALYTVQEGYGYMLAPYSTVSDELHWIGSRDAWFELELGTPGNPANEFVDGAFPFFAQGRWMADEAIKILVQHQTDGVLADETDLARAYLFAAMSYVNIADWMDDFAFSDRRESGPPIGDDNMGGLYTTAIGYLGSGLGIVGGSGSDLERSMLAMRARARHAGAVWNMIGPSGASFPVANPLVSDAAAVADATAALSVDNSDWDFVFDYGASTVWDDAGWQVNARLELRFSDDYIVAASDDNTRDLTAPDRGVRLQDPIDAVGDPRLDVIMTAFEGGERYADLTILSAREMHLILAEDALANGNVTGANSFEQWINSVRAFGGMTPWVSGGAGMPAAQDLLIHERRVNLFLQGRRLNDMYRFGIQSSMWEASSSAVTNPGSFLPITKIELDANCHLNPDFEC